MKILMAHNYYQLAGGEDVVFRAEVEMLRQAGHEVVEYTKSNEELDKLSRIDQMRTMLQNPTTITELTDVLIRENVDIAHFHNTLAVISPSAYRACRDAKVPIVQTLHNYRQLCPNALFYRDGHACEDCLGKQFPWPGVKHACYRGSRSASLAIALMLSKSRRLTYESVTKFICLTDFAREKHIEGGLPGAKISVKPNFLSPDPGDGQGGDYGLFVGRLSDEKGPDVLLRAWIASGTARPLKIVGDGPMLAELQQQAARHANIEFLGRRVPAEVRALQQGAAVTLITSRVYEGLSMALVESFACGTPVIGPHHAAIPELVSDGGWTYLPENIESLADLIRDLDDAAYHRARPRARALFESHYTAERNLALLLEIYESARQGAR